MKYWWIAAIIIVLAALMVTFAWLLRKSRKTSMIVLFVLSVVLLIFKSIQFGIERSKFQYPVEFSHLSYFILGVTVAMGSKKLRPFAGICAFISGAGFIIAGIASPSSIYLEAENHFKWITGILQHEALLFGGILIIFNTDKYDVKDIWISILGIVCMIIFSVLVYYRILYPDLAQHNRDNMIIIFVLYGTILKYVIPSGVVPIWLRVFTIIGELILLGVILWAFYYVNHKVYDKKLEKYPLYEGNNEEYGIIPLVKYIVEKQKEKKTLQVSSTTEEQEVEAIQDSTEDTKSEANK